MRKIWLLLCFFIMGSVSAMAQNGFQIVGNVAGLPDGELSLIAVRNTGSEILGKTQAVNGQFEFAGEVSGVVWAYIQTGKQQVVASIMLENAEFNVLAGGVVLGGGNAQQLLARFDALNTDLFVRRQALETEYQTAEKNCDRKKMQEIDSRFQQILVELQAKEEALLKENANSYVAAYVVASTMREVDLQKLEERYALLGEQAKASYFGKEIEKQIEKYKQVEVNGLAPDFKLPNMAGNMIGLYNTKAKAKIVYFWASYNQASRTLNVELLKLYQQYYPQGLEIIGVSVDDDEQAWHRAIGEDGVTWLSCSDLCGENSDVVSLYCIRSLPVLFLLDADNNIVAKNLYGSDLRKRLVDILKEK